MAAACICENPVTRASDELVNGLLKCFSDDVPESSVNGADGDDRLATVECLSRQIRRNARIQFVPDSLIVKRILSNNHGLCPIEHQPVNARSAPGADAGY